MKQRYVYLVETNEERRRYATVFTKKIAETLLKGNGGGTVYALSRRSFNDPSCIYGWDVPTFKTCSSHSWSVAA